MSLALVQLRCLLVVDRVLIEWVGAERPLPLVSRSIYKIQPCMGSLPATDHPKTDMWSGFIAVFVVNLIIAAYVVMAFREEDDPKGTDTRGGRPARPGMAGSKERTD